MGLGIWWRVGILAAFVLMIAGAIWYVHHTIYREGYTDAESVYKPKVAKLETDLKNAQDDIAKAVAINEQFKRANDELKKQVQEQALSIQQFQADADAAREAARKAMQQVIREQAANTRNRAEIKRLQDIVNGPPMTEGDCAEADNILRTLLRDRGVPNAGATPAPSH